MKCLLLFPPQWIPFNPHLALPAIQGTLQDKGHEVIIRDLNIEFYNTVLNPDFVVKSLQKAFDDYNANAAHVFSQYTNGKPLNEYPVDYQRVFSRYMSIKELAENGEYQYLIQNIVKATQILRSKKDYYNLHLFEWAITTLDKTTKLLSSLYQSVELILLQVLRHKFTILWMILSVTV